MTTDISDAELLEEAREDSKPCARGLSTMQGRRLIEMIDQLHVALATVTRELEAARKVLGVCEKPGACNCLPCIYGRYSEERAAYREKARNLSEQLAVARVVVEAAREWRDATEVANQNPGMLLSSQRTGYEAAKAMSDMFTAEECVYVAIAAFDALTQKDGQTK